MVKVQILFGKVINGSDEFGPGETIEIPEDKITAFGSQVRVVRQKAAVKEPEQPPAPEQAPLTGEPEEPVEKKKGK